MRGMRRAIATAGFLSLALLPMIAAMSPAGATSAHDVFVSAQMPVAITQPLAAMDGGPIVAAPLRRQPNSMLLEAGVLVLVGSALLALGGFVRRTTSGS